MTCVTVTAFNLMCDSLFKIVTFQTFFALFLISLPYFFFQFAKFLPDVCSKFIACYGIATILDPVLLFIVDIAYHNYNCSSYYSSCMTDYTSNKCLCFNGDFIKLFNRTINEEGSGVTGVILVVIIYVISIIVSTLLLYEYLVYVHKDARILDLWRRVKGNFCNKVPFNLTL